MSNNLTTVRESVQTCLSSIFTKEDVIKILDGLQSDTTKTDVPLPSKSDLSDKIKDLYLTADTLQDAINDLNVDTDNMTLSLDGNYITVDNYDLNKGDIEDGIEDVKSKLEAIAKMLQIDLD